MSNNRGDIVKYWDMLWTVDRVNPDTRKLELSRLVSPGRRENQEALPNHVMTVVAARFVDIDG